MPPPLDASLPHARIPPAARVQSNDIPKMPTHRRLEPMQTKNMQASTPPPRENRRDAGRAGTVSAALIGAVVLMVRTAVPAPVPVIITGFVAPKLSVGRSCAPVGLEVRAAVNSIVPVKPLFGVMVIVEEFPVDAPGDKVVEVPLSAKLG